MTTVDELVAFLMARLDEMAEAANWASTTAGVNEQWRVLKRVTVVLDAATALEVSERAVAHIKMNDPAFVLADIAAKRRIIAQCVAELGRQPEESAWLAYALALETLELFAVPFAGHRDYRQEWRPDA